MRRKKILIVITKSNFGGAQRYVFDIASSLSPSEEVVVLLGGDGLLTRRLEERGIRTIRVPSLMRDINPLRDLASFTSLFSHIRRERPDVLHVNSAKAGGLGALAGRLLGVHRIIFTAHGWAFNEPRGYLSRMIIRWLSYFTILLSHQTIAVSEALKRQVPGWLANKVVVIPNGIGSITALPRNEARAFLFGKCAGLQLSTTDDTLWITTIAELHPIKNLTNAIDAVGTLIGTFPNLRYIIMGDGELRQTLERRIREKGLSNHVFLAGFIFDAPKYLSASDIFLLPSLSEGLAYVLLEAGMVSLPVVATRVGGIPEVIEHHQSGVLVGTTPESIADGITEILTADILRTRYGGALHERILQKFTLTTMLEKTRATYQ